MKRILSVFLCITLLLMSGPAWAEETGETPATPIASREDMLLLAQDPAGSFELAADIDMGAEPWTPIPFSGTLDGQGHTLYNLQVRAPGAQVAETYDGNYRTYDTVFAGLFSILDGGRVANLSLVNATVVVDTDRHCFLGTVAGLAKGATVENCSVQARNHLTLTSINAGVGGLAGFSVESEFLSCTVDAELVFTDTNQEDRCEEFLGGVYSCGCGRIDHCDVRVRGFAEVFGYAHSGGLIGMHKLPERSYYKSAVNYTTADTEISFFEITPSRRAYCSPTIGEDTDYRCARWEMVTTHYERFESPTPVRLSPEKCEEPHYAAEVVAPTCTDWGYTVHTCEVCGYSFRDEYTAPAHDFRETERIEPTCTEAGSAAFVCNICGQTQQQTLPPTEHQYAEERTEPTCTKAGKAVYTCRVCGHSYEEKLPAKGHTSGDWTMSREPGIDREGTEERLCLTCGKVLESRTLPAIPYTHAERIELSAERLELLCGEVGFLSATVYPEDATDQTVTFMSSDRSVARVLEDGTLITGNRGTATITCVSADGKATAGCVVTVRFTRAQWIRYYLLFGWLRG